MPGRFFALAFAALLAGCSAGGSSAPAPAPVATHGQQTTGSITLAIGDSTGSTPAAGSRTAAARKPLFVSPGASSVGISINGGTDTFADVSATSPNCTGAGNARTCTIAISAPSGSPVITVAIFDGPNGTGHLISQGSATPAVTAGQTFSVSITMLPVVKFLNTGTVTYASGTSFTIGTAGTATVTLGADDAALQAIPASATFAVPVLLTSSDPHVTITPASWTSPSQPIALTYDGSASVGATVMVSFATGGTTLVSLPITPGGALSVSEFPVTTVASEPEGITKGPDGNLWFAEQTGNNIARMTTAGVVTEFAVPTVNSAPTAVVTGSDGNLYFTEQQNSLTSKVGMINPATHIFTEISAGISAFASPYQITSNSTDGNVYFTEFSTNKIGRINLPAGTITEFTIPTPNTEPSYIVTGPDGALWFTQTGTTQIGRMTTAGVFSETSIPTGASTPSGIAVGPDGALWFVESTGNKVGRITTAGVITTEITIPTANSNPMTIVTGADGNLWFTENANAANKITRMTTAGVFTEFAIPTANSGPCSTTLGPDNHIWFAEDNAAGNKIARI